MAHLYSLEQTFEAQFLGVSRNSSLHGSGKIIPAGSFRWEMPEWDFTSEAHSHQFSPAPSGKAMADFALKFLHVPYVWGGKTEWGLDCSGLVQLVMNLAQFSFPRDAWQQAETGKEISFDNSDPAFEPGNLLFFKHPGKRIHHVGISLGGGQFVHASEWVRVQSLSADHPDFAPERMETLALVKRPDFSALTEMTASVKKLFFNYQNI